MKRITLYGKLNGHKECVNTVEFNSTGDVLVSGSDDKHVIFWDWAAKSKTFSYSSGHLDNIFQARIMPFTDDRKVVTSSCDGQVSLHPKSYTLFYASFNIFSFLFMKMGSQCMLIINLFNIWTSCLRLLYL